MTSVSKNVFIDRLDDIIQKYNNTYHRTIKIKPTDVKTSMYIEYVVEYNGEEPKLKVAIM